MRNKYISWLPAILIMLLIFYLSSKPASVSGESSLRLTEYIMRLYEKIMGMQVEEGLRADRLLALDHYIRKTAHVIEYAVLALAICYPLYVRGLKGGKLWLWSVLFTAAYAATDELHQRFVPGRSGELKDVLIDSSGAVLGALAFLLAVKVTGKLVRHKKRPELKSE